MYDEHPFPLAEACLKCPQRVRERKQIIHGYGDPQARVMFIGTAPDSLGANQTGVPWTRSVVGQRMQVVLRSVGLRNTAAPEHERPALAQTYMTYLVRCATHADLRPSRTDIAHCVAYLWREMALIKPAIVVPVGELPTRLICAKFLHTIPGTMEDIHAQVFPTQSFFIVPSLDMHVIQRDEALLLARVLAALLEQ